jgi:hypothetical protein
MCQLVTVLEFASAGEDELDVARQILYTFVPGKCHGRPGAGIVAGHIEIGGPGAAYGTQAARSTSSASYPSAASQPPTRTRGRPGFGSTSGQPERCPVCRPSSPKRRVVAVGRDLSEGCA